MATTTYEPMYRTIMKDILDMIESEALKSGDKTATEFEIMEQYGVSRITAVRALTELAKAGYIRRARKTGSVVIGLGKTLSTPKLEPVVFTTSYQHVPLVIPFAPDNGFDILGGIQKEAQSRNILITLFNSERQLDKEKEILTQLLDMPISGLICLPIESYSNISCYTKLQAKNIPIVFVDRPLRYLDVPYVSSDNFNAMKKLTQWLLNKGHQRIAFLAHDLNAYNESQRFKGYLRALMENGLELNNSYISQVNNIGGDLNMLQENDRGVSQFINQYLSDLMKLDNPPTALICTFDTLASYVEQQASILGISIPTQLSITGFDNIFLCNHLEVPLTTVAQDYVSIGQKAIELLVAIQNNQQINSQYLVDTSLVKRDSVLPIEK